MNIGTVRHEISMSHASSYNSFFLVQFQRRKAKEIELRVLYVLGM